MKKNTYRLDYTKTITGYFEVEAKDKNEAMKLILSNPTEHLHNDIEETIDYDKDEIELVQNCDKLLRT